MTGEDDQLPKPADESKPPTRSATEPNRREEATAVISDAADSMHEVNRLLWEIAKSVGIIAAILLLISLVVLAWYAAEFLATF